MTVTDKDSSSNDVELEPELTAAATAEAQKLVNSFVRKCLSHPGMSFDCPVNDPGDRYTLTKMPTIELTASSYDDKYRVTTKTQGKAHYVDKSLPSVNGDRELIIYGHVSISGDKLTYDPKV